MEMMEKIKIPDMALEKTDPCWFCEKEKEDDQVENEEDEQPESPEGYDEDNVKENYETNDASKLGKNLQNRPTWRIKHKLEDLADEDPIKQGENTDIVPAAHHLIPGNASMKYAQKLHKYMKWKGNNDKNLWGPVGYNINSRQNGVWLPGNYAVRKNTDFGQNWSKFSPEFQIKYAKNAMANAQNKQLHDAHSDYNKNVKDTLNDIAEKLDGLWTESSKCPLCNKDLTKKDGKFRPPFGLVGRLNLISEEHEKSLIFPKNNKKAINNGYYTSSKVLAVYG